MVKGSPMKTPAFVIAVLLGLASAPCLADLNVLGAFVDERQFAVVMTEAGEVPFYWTNLKQSQALLPVYSNSLVLKGTHSISPQRQFLETHTPVLLSYRVSGARLEKGVLTLKAESRFFHGVKSVVGGHIKLKNGSVSRVFHFDPAATERLKNRETSPLVVKPFVSPRELVVLLDAGEWRSGTYFIIDREVLPLEQNLYRAHLSDGTSVREVGTFRTFDTMENSAISMPLTFGAEIAFSTDDLGPNLPALWSNDPNLPDAKLQYLEVSGKTAASLGYDLGLLEFPKSDACVGWLLER